MLHVNQKLRLVGRQELRSIDSADRPSVRSLIRVHLRSSATSLRLLPSFAFLAPLAVNRHDKRAQDHGRQREPGAGGAAGDGGRGAVPARTMRRWRAEFKALRHRLAGVMAGVPGLLDGRDTPGDVGTAITTEAEGQRADAAAVALAAGKRLSEALRSLEEYGKTLGAGTRGAAAGRGGDAVRGVRAGKATQFSDVERDLIGAVGTPGGGTSGAGRVCLLAHRVAVPAAVAGGARRGT